MPLAQSAPDAQPVPAGQVAPVPDPLQSSLQVPQGFLFPSSHVSEGARSSLKPSSTIRSPQTGTHTPSEQELRSQSAFVAQPVPMGQSRPVTVPVHSALQVPQLEALPSSQTSSGVSVIPLPHTATHSPPKQEPLKQSSSDTHPVWIGHVAPQPGPVQRTPHVPQPSLLPSSQTSPPSCMPLPQFAAHLPPEQRPLVQSSL